MTDLQGSPLAEASDIFIYLATDVFIFLVLTLNKLKNFNCAASQLSQYKCAELLLVLS